MVAIPILGSYNKRNVGDDAFKEVFETVVPQIDPSAKISYHTERHISPENDKIILGAGDVVRPFYLERFQSTQTSILSEQDLVMKARSVFLKADQYRCPVS
jgi:hypothetical protein